MKIGSGQAMPEITNTHAPNCTFHHYTACLTGDKDPPGFFQGAWKIPGAAKSSGPWKFPGPWIFPWPQIIILYVNLFDNSTYPFNKNCGRVGHAIIQNVSLPTLDQLLN